jgi:hypothetical protein
MLYISDSARKTMPEKSVYNFAANLDEKNIKKDRFSNK